jgi:hypothetical protein
VAHDWQADHGGNREHSPVRQDPPRRRTRGSTSPRQGEAARIPLLARYRTRLLPARQELKNWSGARRSLQEELQLSDFLQAFGGCR